MTGSAVSALTSLCVLLTFCQGRSSGLQLVCLRTQLQPKGLLHSLRHLLLLLHRLRRLRRLLLLSLLLPSPLSPSLLLSLLSLSLPRPRRLRPSQAHLRWICLIGLRLYDERGQPF